MSLPAEEIIKLLTLAVQRAHDPMFSTPGGIAYQQGFAARPWSKSRCTQTRRTSPPHRSVRCEITSSQNLNHIAPDG